MQKIYFSRNNIMPREFVNQETGEKLWVAADGTVHPDQQAAYMAEAGDAFAARVERHIRSREWPKGPGKTSARKAITAFLIDEQLQGEALGARIEETAAILQQEAAEETARKEEVRKAKSERMKQMHAAGGASAPQAPPAPPPAAA
jgi:hypothetical protein